jgi:hypothetical protein
LNIRNGFYDGKYCGENFWLFAPVVVYCENFLIIIAAEIAVVVKGIAYRMLHFAALIQHYKRGEYFCNETASIKKSFFLLCHADPDLSGEASGTQVMCICFFGLHQHYRRQVIV